MPVSEKYWWKLVALFFLGWILMYADRTILNPVIGQNLTGWIADTLGSMKVGFYLAAILLLIGMVVFTFTTENKEEITA